MTEPTLSPAPLAFNVPIDQQSPLDTAATSLPVRHNTLPRIRPSQHAESASEAAPNDVSSVSALAPRSTVAAPVSDPRQLLTRLAARRANRAAAAAAQASQPLHRMLSQFDAPDRIRWSGVTMVLFYVITVITWPSLLVSFLGAATGVIGFLSCSPPHTLAKIMWAYVYHWLNVVMLVVIWWTALDQLVLQGEGSASAGVGYMYLAAFVLLGSVLHGRTLSATSALVRKCRLRELIVEVVWPERWRRQPEPGTAPNPTVPPEPTVEPRPSLIAEADRASSHSSIHSFEIDVEWHEGRRFGHGVCGSPVASPTASPSPLTSYKRIGEPAPS